MDNMEQDPEEIPMDQVLAEIRQMLMAQESVPEKEDTAHSESPKIPQFFSDEEVPLSSSIPDQETDQPVDKTELPEQQAIPTVPPAPVLAPDIPKQTAPDFFLLTPAMRCDLPPDSELSEAVQKQTTRVLNKLQQQSNAELSPALIEWLNANLPAMIEKVLAKNQKKEG